jgi:hypothetical protein
MIKITIKAESIPTPDLFVKALVVLPEPAVIAFHTEEHLLYIKDDYAMAAVAYLKQAGIDAQIVPRAEGQT